MIKTSKDHTGFKYAMHFVENMLNWRLLNPSQEFKKAPVLDVELLPDSFLKKLIKLLDLVPEEITLLLLTLTPHLAPELIAEAVNQVYKEGGELPQLGGLKGTNHRGFLPTGETALYVLGGTQVEHRTACWMYFDSEAALLKNQVIRLKKPPQDEPIMSGQLLLETDYIQLLITGKIPDPELSIAFPAKKISTTLNWEDLILEDKTKKDIEELEIWLKHQHTLSEKHDTRKKFKPGYTALFYGPPGTGKTLTASLLGKYTSKAVYRIDLSVVVSKYIGETEKNLSKLFDRARYKEWILFFDEADAIFGKRTQVRDAHDKYANQEVSYLLQRLEEHPGLVILASNFKSNIDAAFTRRFQSIIHFSAPEYASRLKLWENALPQGFKFSKEVDLTYLAKTYDITGANINNISQYCCLQALHSNTQKITQTNLIAGIKREYIKEDKMF